MKILLVHGVGHQERPDNQPWERPWEEAITAGLQYFDPAFAPTYERFDYDSLFSGKINLLTDVGAAAHLGFAPLGAAIEDTAQTVSGWFRPRRGLLDWVKPAAEAADGWHAGMRQPTSITVNVRPGGTYIFTALWDSDHVYLRPTTLSPAEMAKLGL